MEELLKAEEVAELLRVDRNTIYIWTRSGKIKYALRIGREYRYRKSDIIGENKEEDENSRSI